MPQAEQESRKTLSLTPSSIPPEMGGIAARTTAMKAIRRSASSRDGPARRMRKGRSDSPDWIEKESHTEGDIRARCPPGDSHEDGRCQPKTSFPRRRPQAMVRMVSIAEVLT